MEIGLGVPTRLDVHGLGVALGGDWPEVVEQVRLDFAWFERRAPGARSADVEVTIERRAPDFEALGNGLASFVTPATSSIKMVGARSSTTSGGRFQPLAIW